MDKRRTTGVLGYGEGKELTKCGQLTHNRGEGVYLSTEEVRRKLSGEWKLLILLKKLKKSNYHNCGDHHEDPQDHKHGDQISDGQRGPCEVSGYYCVFYYRYGDVEDHDDGDKQSNDSAQHCITKTSFVSPELTGSKESVFYLFFETDRGDSPPVINL